MLDLLAAKLAPTLHVTLDGQPTIAMGVFLQTGANALEVAEKVQARMDELKVKFPEGMGYVIPFDTTRFVSASIHEVVKTLIEAMILVLAVVYIFLQNWRATLIPMTAVPISLIGTFAGLWLFGFSINMLTLFAMVLAIGIVVDDAIVVLENVERLMSEEKLPPRQAAIKGMKEVQGAVIATTLVLVAVFVPVAFLGGIDGVRAKGASVHSSVTKDLTYLVKGADASGPVSSKEKAAQKLIAQGAALKILSEDELLAMLDG